MSKLASGVASFLSLVSFYNSVIPVVEFPITHPTTWQFLKLFTSPNHDSRMPNQAIPK